MLSAKFPEYAGVQHERRIKRRLTSGSNAVTQNRGNGRTVPSSNQMRKLT
jgi:hypothetical protein